MAGSRLWRSNPSQVMNERREDIAAGVVALSCQHREIDPARDLATDPPYRMAH
jgi:hypothetical protein